MEPWLPNGIVPSCHLLLHLVTDGVRAPDPWRWLFVGSAAAIEQAGPAVIISYLLAGTLVVLVMRMLGEMATSHPDTGSFSVYSDRALGPWAGFSVGWLYWWFWVLVIPAEATAAATILTDWLGGAQWVSTARPSTARQSTR